MPKRGMKTTVSAPDRPETDALRGSLLELQSRVEQLESDVGDLRDALDAERHRQFYAAELLAPPPQPTRWIAPTSDGWLQAKSNGKVISVPSLLSVTLTSTSGGRDYFKLAEGVLQGTECDAASGFLGTDDPRVPAVRLVCAPAQPVVFGGETFDRSLTVFYRTVPTGAESKEGPFPAKVSPQNPLAPGTYPIEIADFPHESIAAYGAYRTVWFRIGRNGDKYLHVGRISAGCVTCAPQGDNWTRIYRRLAPARLDSRTVGTLEMLK